MLSEDVSEYVSTQAGSAGDRLRWSAFTSMRTPIAISPSGQIMFQLACQIPRLFKRKAVPTSIAMAAHTTPPAPRVSNSFVTPMAIKATGQYRQMSWK